MNEQDDEMRVAGADLWEKMLPQLRQEMVNWKRNKTRESCSSTSSPGQMFTSAT